MWFFSDLFGVHPKLSLGWVKKEKINGHRGILTILVALEEQFKTIAKVINRGRLKIQHRFRYTIQILLYKVIESIVVKTRMLFDKKNGFVRHAWKEVNLLKSSMILLNLF